MRRSHEEHELAWTASGRGVVECEGERFPLDDLWAVWLPAGSVHRVEADDDALILPVWFDPDWFDPWTDHPAPVLRTPALDRLIRTVLQPGLIGSDQAAIATDRLHTVVGTCLREDSATTLPHSKPARAVALALLTDPGRPETVDEWACTVHVSGKTLQRAFVADTGLSFRRWRTRVRLAAALPRLRAGETVEATSAAVGFRSPSAFTAACRTELSMTPGQLRQTHRTTEFAHPA